MERFIAKKKYKENLTAACIIAGILLIFFSNAIFTGKALVAAGNIFVQPFYNQYAPSGFTRAPNILLDDQHIQFYPQHYFVSQSLKNGDIPLWNPHVLLGVSVNGTAINGMFYPWNLLMAFLPLTVVLWLRPFLNFWIAGFFTFLYVRRLGGSLAGSYLAAVSFMLSGFLVVWLGHPHVNAAVWLPVLLYLIELFIYGGVYRKIYPFFISVVISFVFFSGHMETAFEVCLVCFLYYINRGYQVHKWRWIVNNAPIVIGTFILGVLLAAVQILPFLEWLFLSAEFAARSASKFVFINWHYLKQLPSLLALFLPNFLINPSQIDFPLIQLVPWGNFNETAAYIGILPLIIAIQAALLKSAKNKLIPFFMGWGVFFLCLAFRLPVFDCINQLPVFNIFAAGRWRLIFDLFIAVAAGLSLDVWINSLADGNNWRKTARFFLICGLLAFFSVGVVSFLLSYLKEPIIKYGQAYAKAKYLATTIHSRPLDQVLSDISILFDRVMHYFSIQNWRLYFPGIILTAAAGLIFAWGKNKIKLKVLKVGIISLVVLDLFVFGIGYTPVIAEKDLYPKTPAIKFLKADKTIFRILPVRTEWVSNAPMVYNISEMGGSDLPTKYYEEFTDAIDGKDGQGFEFFAVQSANSKLIDLMNVKYIVTTNKFSPNQGRDIQLCWQKDGIFIYENHNVLPRAFIVHKVRFINKGELIQELHSPLFSPAEEVLLTDKWSDDFDYGEAEGKGESVEIELYEPAKIILHTKSQTGGMLVLSDAYYPGWKAYLNKQEVEIYRANGVMRSVKIPKGDNKLEFYYKPDSMHVGGMISVIAYLLLIFACGIILVRIRGKMECNGCWFISVILTMFIFCSKLN